MDVHVQRFGELTGHNDASYKLENRNWMKRSDAKAS